jgi:hypothetical protein
VRDPDNPKSPSRASAQVVNCANPACGTEFTRKPGRGRPRLFCKPACRVAAFQQAKTRAPTDRFLQIGRNEIPESKLTRVAFRVSRLMEFCSERELQNQTGHAVYEWPLVVLKELMDNALDACEEAEIAPVISITVKSPCTIIIEDNGNGIDAETIKSILDYSIRVSSREAYVSPTRGAQGNALKTVLAMGYVLDRKGKNGKRNAEPTGVTIIESRGVKHRIEFREDHVNSQPKLSHVTSRSAVKTGTRITVEWGLGSQPLLRSRHSEFTKLAEAYAWFNPHLSLRGIWYGKRFIDVAATNPNWEKWKPRNPTGAHWYDESRLQRYISAHVARDRDENRQRTVREFVAEFRGFAGSAAQSKVLKDVGCSRMTLAKFFGIKKPNRTNIRKLLSSLQRHSAPVVPKLLGVIGETHLKQRFLASGGNEKTFQYRRRMGYENGIPYITEFAFGVHQSGLRGRAAALRKFIAGANWSVGIENPFRTFGSTGEGLETTLAKVRASAYEPVICVLHLACARIQFADRGKSSIILDSAEQPQ